MPAYINPDSEDDDKGEYKSISENESKSKCESNAELADIKAVADRMNACRRKCELGRIIAEEIAKYSRYDLQIISARVRKEVEILPEPYRSKFRPYSEIWFFGRYHKLLLLSREGAFNAGADSNSNSADGDDIAENRFYRDITDIETFKKFCGVIPEACMRDDEPNNEASVLRRYPRHNLFYYLLNAFAMFVLDEPGHPVGTPFPGGFEVTHTAEGYFCPIREKEEEILHSICNFCPAKQDPRNL